MDDTPGDLGGYGPEDDFESPLKRQSLTDSIRSSARRTGDRDERGKSFHCSSGLRKIDNFFLGPFERFLCLVEDIFEAENDLPSGISISDFPDFFSSLSIDPSQPHIHSNHIRKLTKYIGQVTRPNQRLRNATAGITNTPRAQGRMAEVKTKDLSRLLNILDRTVKAGEDLDPFRYVAPPPGSARSSPKKKANPKAKKGEPAGPQTPRAGGSDDLPGQGSVEEGRGESEAELTDSDYEKLTHALDLARESIWAADCCIALLGSDRLSKQVCGFRS